MVLEDVRVAEDAAHVEGRGRGDQGEEEEGDRRQALETDKWLNRCILANSLNMSYLNVTL